MLRVGSRLIVAAISVASLQAAVLPSDALAARTITLDEAIARALQVAPSMESAAAQSDLDSARFKKALAPFFPGFWQRRVLPALWLRQADQQ
jgi:hypothetical protein